MNWQTLILILLSFLCNGCLIEESDTQENNGLWVVNCASLKDFKKTQSPLFYLTDKVVNDTGSIWAINACYPVAYVMVIGSFALDLIYAPLQITYGALTLPFAREPEPIELE